jgi:hypothetical protein
LWRSRRGARPERGTPPPAPTIYKAPAAVREAPLWTGRYGCLNAGFGWANEAVKETGATGGQHPLLAPARSLHHLQAAPRASLPAVDSGLIIKSIEWFWESKPTGNGRT